MDLITTAPTVIYEVILRDGTALMLDNPAKMPTRRRSRKSASLSSRSHLYMPQEYVG